MVTGDNKGIGLQISKDLAARGFTVLVGSRNFEKGKKAVISVGADARAIQLDVTDQHSIDAATGCIRSELGRLDVLINNAGISHAGEPGRKLEEVGKSGRPSVVSIEEVRTVFETNVFGVIAVTQAMLPLLRKAPAARIINVSSGSGSLTLNADPNNSHRGMFGAVYSPSKTALNAITLALLLNLNQQVLRSMPYARALPQLTSTILKEQEPFNRQLVIR